MVPSSLFVLWSQGSNGAGERLFASEHPQDQNRTRISRPEVAMNQDQHAQLPAFIVLSPEDVAARAYEIYLKRGASDGFDRDDWFHAEQELKARGRDAYRRSRAQCSS
jgi:hypothetical protein